MANNSASIAKRTYFTKQDDIIDPPNLVSHQNNSFQWFVDEGLGELLAEISPIDDINQQQQHMEMINTELGYLLPHAEREEFGKITPEGRFRIWKEAWQLDYLGIAGRYT